MKKKLVLITFFTLIGLSSIFFVSALQQEEINITAIFCPIYDCKEFLKHHIQKNFGSKCVFYDLNHEEIIRSLNKTNSSVLVFDQNYKGFGEKVSSKGLMHHKFCILNSTHTIITSANPTYNDLEINTNNMLLIKSKTISKNYLSEYLYIKNSKNFNTNNKIVSNDIIIQNYFCPKDECKQKIVDVLKKAEKSIYFKTFTFTDSDIASILIQKNESGLNVFGVTDIFQNHRFWVVPMLKDLVVVQNKKSKQHSKVFVIDEKIVITGSYNPTNAANTINNENILIISNKELANFYLSEINRIINSN
ncbi:MAG: phospholipase D-like domain-containing protein [Candidatus Woesearchaeota archaeon]